MVGVDISKMKSYGRCPSCSRAIIIDRPTIAKWRLAWPLVDDELGCFTSAMILLMQLFNSGSGGGGGAWVCGGKLSDVVMVVGWCEKRLSSTK